MRTPRRFRPQRDALAVGCDAFDTKPIEFDRLVATMQRILATRK